MAASRSAVPVDSVRARVHHQTVPVFRHHVAQITELGFGPFRFLEQPRERISQRLVRLVRTLLFAEVDGRIAAGIFWWRQLAALPILLRLKTLLPGPRLDQRAIDGEVVIAQ